MTPDRPVRVGVAVALGVVTLMSVAGVVAALVGRTMLPFAVEGTVVSVQERNRDPGTEVWVVNLSDGSRWFVDDEAARAFRPGVVSKAAWSPTVRVGTTERTIGLSRDLVGPLSWVLLTATAVIVVLARRVGHGSRAVSSQLNTTRSPDREATRPA